MKWKDRLKLPARSLFAQAGDLKATATWELRGQVWICASSTKHLKWMRRMTDGGKAKAELVRRGFTAEWIIPSSTRKPVEPPFKLP